jgi:sugar/nucleoside kinase (ribokinase family)
MTSSGRPWDVVGVGANSVDFVSILPGYPRPHGSFAKMRVRKRHVLCGGQTATAVTTCASFGLRCKYVGVSGTDDNGQRIRTELSAGGVDVEDVIIREAENQFAVVLVDETTGERIVIWDRDERLRFREHELPLDALRSARVVHVDDVDDDVAVRAARVGLDAGAMVTSDIDRLTPLTEQLAAMVTHAIFAQHVPSELTGIDDAERALRKMRRRQQNLLCVTLGEQGAMALDGDRLFHEPAFSVRPVDTTGAGDVFRGGFIYALLLGQPTGQALRTANAAAAISCTRLGALSSIPTLVEVGEMMAAGSARA